MSEMSPRNVSRAEYDDDGEALGILDERVVARVRCSVFREVPREAALEQCHNGHVICSDCRREVERRNVQMQCPECRVGMDKKNIIINRTAEALRDTMFKFSCKMHKQGCRVRATKPELEEHERDCPYRLLPCAYEGDGCKELVAAHRMEEHICKCRYRRIHCVVNRCDATMAAVKLDDHVREMHDPCGYNHSPVTFYPAGAEEHDVLFKVGT